MKLNRKGNCLSKARCCCQRLKGDDSTNPEDMLEEWVEEVEEL